MHFRLNKDPYVTVNPCRLCTPLGASLAFRGIRNCMPLIHGSQGCATYIRRFLISHFREPMDIASSSFSEETAIFGGENNLLEAINNVINQYHPEVIGIASSCLTETIGDDIQKIIKMIRSKIPCNLIAVSTPSFKLSHRIGYHETVNEIVKYFCKDESKKGNLFIAPPILSPADIRYLKSLCRQFELNPLVLPDYSETLDGGLWDENTLIPFGGTPPDDIRFAGSPEAIFIELGSKRETGAGAYLFNTFGTKHLILDTPIGIEATDRFLSALSEISGNKIPERILNVRRRCIDSYIDAHKYVSGANAFVFGDEDMVPSIVEFCLEIGLNPILCASEGNISSNIKNNTTIDQFNKITICENADFDIIENAARNLRPDIMIGTGKGNHISIKLGIPLVRVGFPIHDRFGASRILHLGYDGAMLMLDNIVNTLLSGKQDGIPDGYSYL